MFIDLTIDKESSVIAVIDLTEAEECDEVIYECKKRKRLPSADDESLAKINKVKEIRPPAVAAHNAHQLPIEETSVLDSSTSSCDVDNEKSVPDPAVSATAITRYSPIQMRFNDFMKRRLQDTDSLGLLSSVQYLISYVTPSSFI